MTANFAFRSSLFLALAGLAAPTLAEAAVRRVAEARVARVEIKAPRPSEGKLGDRRAAIVENDGPLERALPKATAEKDLAHVITQVKALAQDGKQGVVIFDIDDTLVQTQTKTPGK